MARAASKLPGSMRKTQRIVLNNEWTSEKQVKTYQDGKRRQLTSKRRKRGKCLYYDDRNTANYYPTCWPGRKHWVCGPPAEWNAKTKHKHIQCQKLHKNA